MTKSVVDLDDHSVVTSLDKDNMLGAIAGFADQCEEAVGVGRRAQLTIDTDIITNIVVAGMGGSAISGDVCRILFDQESKVPISVSRNYTLPAFVDSGTLILAASYSGNTEETLSAMDEALRRGAQVAVISSGGKISKIAGDKKLTLITIPGGLQPRAALGYLSLTLAVALERMGFAENLDDAFSETFKVIREKTSSLRLESPESLNPAKQFARGLFGKMPVIYGAEGLTGLAAFRFKCQINENAKSPSHWNLLPELDHNELAGWQLLEDISHRFQLIFLRDSDEHPQVTKRVEATRDLIRDQFSGVDEFRSTGTSKLARLFSLIHLGDFTSTYLALLNGLDPSPVERIELLKKRLA